MRNAMTNPAGLIALSLLFLCAGCANETLPLRYLSRPPAGLSAARAEQDQRACVSVAGSAKVERAWAYIACLVSKGYAVDVAFRARVQATYLGVTLGVTQTRPHDQPVIAADIADCRKTAYPAGRTESGSKEEVVSRIENAFRTCLDPRGYMVQRGTITTP